FEIGASHPVAEALSADEGGAAIGSPSPNEKTSIVSIGVGGLFFLASLYTLHFARDILIPIVLAGVLYLVLSPISQVLRGLRLPAAVVAALLVFVFAASLAAGVYSLAGPAAHWLSRAPELAQRIDSKLDAIKRPVQEVKQASEQVEKMASVADRQAAPRVMVERPGLSETLFAGARNLIWKAGVTIVLLYFLLATGEMFREKFIRVMPTFRDKRRAVLLTRDVQQRVSTYLLTIASINGGFGMVIGLGCWLIGMPNPLLWGAMAMVLNFVPYVGLAVGAAVLALVGLVSFDSASQALLPPALYVGVNALEAQFVTPSLLGRRLMLNPVVIFLSVVFWGWLWGVVGALIAVPVLVTIKAISDHFDRLAPLAEFLAGREATTVAALVNQSRTAPSDVEVIAPGPAKDAA
ncbi:MAG TPA: AI-2E family transporter, partial [Alphaproteobacteria bacterium]|nr:AI-2E family transporter [Alphaproteobacteria bacterium]